jgi:Ca2+-binding EF-hand superfamily protein
LKNKLSQKSSGTQSEETVLMKSFKYFDLNNNGTVEPDEFAKAIEKIGIMIPTRQVSGRLNLFTVDRLGSPCVLR